MIVPPLPFKPDLFVRRDSNPSLSRKTQAKVREIMLLRRFFAVLRKLFFFFFL